MVILFIKIKYKSIVEKNSKKRPNSKTYFFSKIKNEIRTKFEYRISLKEHLIHNFEIPVYISNSLTISS